MGDIDGSTRVPWLLTLLLFPLTGIPVLAAGGALQEVLSLDGGLLALVLVYVCPFGVPALATALVAKKRRGRALPTLGLALVTSLVTLVLVVTALAVVFIAAPDSGNTCPNGRIYC